jgi:hypothetical protein
LAGLRPISQLTERWDRLDSVSAYYYTGAVAAFVGVIFALSLFLLTYPGYENELKDRVLGWIGGAAALGVVFLPTTPPNERLTPMWWQPWMHHVHYVSAASLFVSFILFSLWLFPKSDQPPEYRSTDKRVRNAIYKTCGLIMIGAVIWAAIAGLMNKAIFIQEAIAIEAFAVSWLAKGEADQPFRRAARRVMAAQAVQIRS